MGFIKLSLDHDDSKEVMLADALESIRHGWMAGLVSAGLTLLVALAAIGTGSSLIPGEYNAWSLLDVLILGALSYGIYRKSRICAVLMVTLFAGNVVYKLVELGSFNTVGTVIFGYFYIRAVRATFRYHSLSGQAIDSETLENAQSASDLKATQPSALKVVLWVLGTTFTLGMIGLITLLFVFAAYTPPADVVPGAQLDRKYVEAIRALNILGETEKIDFFYTDALFDFQQGFYLLTDQRVIVYSTEFDEPLIAVPFADIVEIEPTLSDSFIEDSMVTLILDDGGIVVFPLSSGNGGDRQFLKALSSRRDEAAEADAVLESRERL